MIFKRSVKLFHVKPWYGTMAIDGWMLETVANELLTLEEIKKYKVPLYYVDYRKYPLKSIYYNQKVRLSSVSGKFICEGTYFINKKGAKLK